jgi:large subunit ribosomal protein L28
MIARMKKLCYTSLLTSRVRESSVTCLQEIVSAMLQCEVCGKSPQFGQNIRNQHSVGWRYRAPRTKRRWLPNLQTVRVARGNATMKIRICVKCLKAGKVARAA